MDGIKNIILQKVVSNELSKEVACELLVEIKNNEKRKKYEKEI